jgi:hypothetical protein
MLEIPCSCFVLGFFLFLFVPLVDEPNVESYPRLLSIQIQVALDYRLKQRNFETHPIVCAGYLDCTHQQKKLEHLVLVS